jgi:hypothetical protein
VEVTFDCDVSHRNGQHLLVHVIPAMVVGSGEIGISHAAFEAEHLFDPERA